METPHGVSVRGGAPCCQSTPLTRRPSCASTFPHVSARLPISETNETVLSPLACAVETISERADALHREAEAHTPDGKQLQLLLQGSVLLQVNAGPLEIARTFLANTFASQPPPHAVAAGEDVAKGRRE